MEKRNGYFFLSKIHSCLILFLVVCFIIRKIVLHITINKLMNYYPKSSAVKVVIPKILFNPACMRSNKRIVGKPP